MLRYSQSQSSINFGTVAEILNDHGATSAYLAGRDSPDDL